MADKRVKRIRRQALDLALLGGADVLFVCEVPDDPLGKGAVFMFGSVDTPDSVLFLKRTLNELKDRLTKIGVDFSYTLDRTEGASE